MGSLRSSRLYRKLGGPIDRTILGRTLKTDIGDPGVEDVRCFVETAPEGVTFYGEFHARDLFSHTFYLQLTASGKNISKERVLEGLRRAKEDFTYTGFIRTFDTRSGEVLAKARLVGKGPLDRLEYEADISFRYRPKGK